MHGQARQAQEACQAAEESVSASVDVSDRWRPVGGPLAILVSSGKWPVMHPIIWAQQVARGTS